MVSSQVGINTKNPEATLDVNGNLKVRNVPTGSAQDSILVIRNGIVKKIALPMSLNSGTCPNFLKDQSSGYHIKFSSSASVPNPNNPLTIQGKNFNPAGQHVNNNTYFFAWTNTTGQPININNLTVNFSGLTCTYN